MTTHDDSRPPHEAEGDQKTFGGVESQGSSPVDLATADAATFRTWLDGYSHGHLAGLTEGYRQGWREADEHAAILGRHAARIVRATADLPLRDVAADERRASASRAFWAERRGEVA